MKFVLLTAALLISSSISYAESIYCTFTEPFITVHFNSETNLVVITNPDHGKVELPGHISFQKMGILKITAETFDYYLEVDTTKEGSDGMSDFTYPFEGIISNQIVGGCETDSLKKYDPNTP